MPTNRRPLRRARKPRLSPEVIAAWQACDRRALHCALQLDPWEPSPLPSEITARGVSEDLPPNPNSGRCWDKAYPKVLALQRELLAVAGWPDCRAAYEHNLAEAVEWREYCAELVRDPDAGPRGSDPAERRQRLKEAREEVAYRKRLLAELKEPVDGER